MSNLVKQFLTKKLEGLFKMLKYLETNVLQIEDFERILSEEPNISSSLDLKKFGAETKKYFNLLVPYFKSFERKKDQYSKIKDLDHYLKDDKIRKDLLRAKSLIQQKYLTILDFLKENYKKVPNGQYLLQKLNDERFLNLLIKFEAITLASGENLKSTKREFEKIRREYKNFVSAFREKLETEYKIFKSTLKKESYQLIAENEEGVVKKVLKLPFRVLKKILVRFYRKLYSLTIKTASVFNSLIRKINKILTKIYNFWKEEIPEFILKITGKIPGLKDSFVVSLISGFLKQLWQGKYSIFLVYQFFGATPALIIFSLLKTKELLDKAENATGLLIDLDKTINNLKNLEINL